MKVVKRYFFRTRNSCYTIVLIFTIDASNEEEPEVAETEQDAVESERK